uniref:TnpV protein n=1 Tax=Carnobacterium maltaromaticum TaxID=2751 RepID=UPI0038FD31A4
MEINQEQLYSQYLMQGELMSHLHMKEIQMLEMDIKLTNHLLMKMPYSTMNPLERVKHLNQLKEIAKEMVLKEFLIK